MAILNTGRLMVNQLEQTNVDISKGKNLVDRVNALETYSEYKESDEIKAIIKEVAIVHIIIGKDCIPV